MKTLSLLLPLSLVLVACSQAPANPSASSTSAQAQIVTQWNRSPTRQIALVSPSGERRPVEVEMAETSEQLAQGLMGRTELPEGTGMLFRFADEQTRSFWMKNTLIPLDVVFFNASGAYISREFMWPCSKEPCKVYFSKAPAQFALEVAAGSAERWGVGEGWKLEE